MLKNFGKLRKNEKKNWGGRRLRNQKKKMKLKNSQKSMKNQIKFMFIFIEFNEALTKFKK